MTRLRLTTGRGMGLIAILAVNAGLVRAFVVQEMFIGGLIMFLGLQLGLLCLLRSQGRWRRFWLGFDVTGMAAVLALFSCDFLPDSPLSRLVFSSTVIAGQLAFTHLPTPLSDRLDDHWDLFLAVVYFVPELISALLGGLIAFRLIPQRPTQSAR